MCARVRGRGGAGNGSGSRRLFAAFLFERCGKSCEAPGVGKRGSTGDGAAHLSFSNAIRVVHGCVYRSIRFFGTNIGATGRTRPLPARGFGPGAFILQPSERRFGAPRSAPKGRRPSAEGDGAFVPRVRVASGASREPGTPAAPRRRVSGRARSPVSRRRVHRRGPARIPRWQSTFSRGNFHARRVPPKRAPVRLAPHVSLPRITRDRTHRSRTRSHGPVVRHTSNQITTLTAAVHSRSLHRRRAELSHTHSRIKTKQC